MAKFDVHTHVTKAIIKTIEAGTMPWRQPWTGTHAATGLPLRSTNEFYRGINILLLWCAAQENGFIEAFNSKLRAECLNAHWFMNLADDREKLEDWRRHYNEDRPHSAIVYNVPIAMHYPDGVPSRSS